MRERFPGEIVPVRAEHSHTYEDDEEKYRAEHSIDLNWVTGSNTVAGSDGAVWLKLSLDKVYCVQAVGDTFILIFIVGTLQTCLFVLLTNL